MKKHDYFTRKLKNREQTKVKKDKILIVCEGKGTEPRYFEDFPVNKEIVDIDVSGQGKNTFTLVKEAVRLKEKAKSEGKPYNQVWVVFDRDSFPASNFHNAIDLCDEKGIEFAVSNEAFEIWYLLHFNYYDSAISRTQYETKLTNALGRKYEKTLPAMYNALKERQEKAIARAKKLRKYQFEMNNNRHIYCNSNPVTTVYKLVEVLNDFIEEE